MEEGEDEGRGGPRRRGVLHLLDGEIDNRRIFLHKEIVLREPLGDKREALIRVWDKEGINKNIGRL